MQVRVYQATGNITQEESERLQQLTRELTRIKAVLTTLNELSDLVYRYHKLTPAQAQIAIEAIQSITEE